ncbi:CTP synthase [Mangrovibacter sp. MFB070]|uniref:glutamine amidotransferase-related protein n=1 Tax=Mangrovibacter sp. MFB070 TaxID=1224318 RepID=UPI0004D8BC34|nr:gamma-glutamyl-gamma-aminobutyrate hydrolase family protein [Mangrovibacter sp. MFB070]KEA52311.1 CTP synthase [Mangrovibacter sp. MFB070]
MTQTFIVDDSPYPARFGVAASLWANAQQRPLWSLRPAFSGDFPDSHQHVCQAGYCVTSGLWLSDTLCEEVAQVSQLATAEPGCVVVLSPAHSAATATLPGTRLYTHHEGDTLQLLTAERGVVAHWQADQWGRWQAQAQPTQGDTLHIGLAGRETDHRLGYPAIVAALGDAADALGVRVQLHFFAPATLSENLAELDGLNGMILPGGSSMAAVNGQIRLAGATNQRALPTLGLCLGMQSMATALVRQTPGFEQANLAEAAPDAPCHSFVRFDDQRHRCGVLPFIPLGRLSNLMPPKDMHYNHRYAFNPALRTQLCAGDGQISAETDGIIEAISLSNHPFWHGVQGHPELSSRPQAPHPLFCAFLQAAQITPA